ncbi:MAG: HlyD family efflux transporter periplasmic adaptor subunit [Anaerovoracaceae bacterium]
MPKIKKKTILLLICVALGLYLITEILPNIINKVTPTMTIEYGKLTTVEETEIYVLRDETVYASTKNGEAEYRVEEGRQIKKGSKTLDLKEVASKNKSDNSANSGGKYGNIMNNLDGDFVKTNGEYAKRKGVFSTYIDGYENMFKVENFSKIEKSTAEKYKDGVEDVRRDEIFKGEPLFKITDNSKWYMMCFIESEKTSRFVEGNRVTVKFKDGEVRATVEKIIPEGDDWRVLFSTNRMYKNFNKIRSADVEIITLDIEGILIPNNCITTKKDKVGVKVIQKTGEEKFVPIKVLGNDSEMSVVSEGYFYDGKGKLCESVKIYDEIIKNP